MSGGKMNWDRARLSRRPKPSQQPLDPATNEALRTYKASLAQRGMIVRAEPDHSGGAAAPSRFSEPAKSDTMRVEDIFAACRYRNLVEARRGFRLLVLYSLEQRIVGAPGLLVNALDRVTTVLAGDVEPALARTCHLTGVPIGSTYGDAVNEVGRRWPEWVARLNDPRLKPTEPNWQALEDDR